MEKYENNIANVGWRIMYHYLRILQNTLIILNSETNYLILLEQFSNKKVHILIGDCYRS